jgi:hypothetical protein
LHTHIPKTRLEPNFRDNEGQFESEVPLQAKNEPDFKTKVQSKISPMVDSEEMSVGPIKYIQYF